MAGILLVGLILPGSSLLAHPMPKLRSRVAVPAVLLQADPLPLPVAVAVSGESAPSRHASAGKLLAQDLSPGPALPRQCGLPELQGTPARDGGPPRYLILSGGGPHGAFGAGFFLGMKQRGVVLPEADVVTGVSTGALQSTFLFLPDGARREARRRSGAPGIAETTVDAGGLHDALLSGHSNIQDLALAYSISAEPEILRKTPLGGLGLIMTGASGSLQPLRDRLMSLIDDDTLREVAVEACRQRKLYVGVTDVGDGNGYAVDLTRLALMAFGPEAADKMQVRAAYVEALIASASVPVGARPVALRMRVDGAPGPGDVHLLVDGGVRFGVFFNGIENASSTDGRIDGDVTLLVNTDLVLDKWTDRDLLHPDDGWMLVTLIKRTVDILSDQVYQFSVEDIRRRASTLRMAYISDALDDEKQAKYLYLGKPCSYWHEEDGRKYHPLEFYPRYMACVMNYGFVRGRMTDWNIPASPGG